MTVTSALLTKAAIVLREIGVVRVMPFPQGNTVPSPAKPELFEYFLGLQEHITKEDLLLMFDTRRCQVLFRVPPKDTLTYGAITKGPLLMSTPNTSRSVVLIEDNHLAFVMYAYSHRGESRDADSMLKDLTSRRWLFGPRILGGVVNGISEFLEVVGRWSNCKLFRYTL